MNSYECFRVCIKNEVLCVVHRSRDERGEKKEDPEAPLRFGSQQEEKNYKIIFMCA